MDGAFSDNLPTLDENTVTVSPFAGETDICPRDDSAQIFHVRTRQLFFWCIILYFHNFLTYRWTFLIRVLNWVNKISIDFFESSFLPGPKYSPTCANKDSTMLFIFFIEIIWLAVRDALQFNRLLCSRNKRPSILIPSARRVRLRGRN